MTLVQRLGVLTLLTLSLAAMAAGAVMLAH